eukprot:TRINITY_DN7046_c0_g2_i1.p1 TRINITY_DN7046_c0_g2~~TRINITY_DN7046_c0_g2_i1.p1  ORF type:complete len:229 (+),score=49.84 TRINITY_DN7046_c0_g2_i1:160-846(+)
MASPSKPGKQRLPHRESTELRDLELVIRAEEMQVLGELESDASLQAKCQKLRQRADEIITSNDRASVMIEELDRRVDELRKHPNAGTLQSELSSVVQDLSIAHNKLQRVESSKAEAMRKLEEAEGILANVTTLGTSRDTTVCHALNGLANTKLLHASGEPLKPEMFEQLRAVTLATQDLSVSHSNARARMEHCLRAAGRLLNELQSVDLSSTWDTVHKLEEQAGLTHL